MNERSRLFLKAASLIDSICQDLSSTEYAKTKLTQMRSQGVIHQGQVEDYMAKFAGHSPEAIDLVAEFALDQNHQKSAGLTESYEAAESAYGDDEAYSALDAEIMQMATNNYNY